MKKIAWAALAAVAFAGPAFAQSETAPVELNAPVACAVQDPATFTLNVTLGSDISDLASYGTVESFSGNNPQQINIACNSAGSNVALSATPMTNSATLTAGAISAGYTNELDFQASFMGGREEDTSGAWWAVNTDGPPVGAASGRPSSHVFGIYATTNTLLIEELNTINEGRRPVAGPYAGSVTITLTP